MGYRPIAEFTAEEARKKNQIDYEKIIFERIRLNAEVGNNSITYCNKKLPQEYINHLIDLGYKVDRKWYGYKISW